MKHKLAMKRFSAMLKNSDIVFVEAGRNLHLEHSTVTFADTVTTLKRSAIPTRSFPYDKLNLDRLYALATQEPEKKIAKSKGNNRESKSKNYIPLFTSACVVTAVAIIVILNDVSLPALQVNEK